MGAATGEAEPGSISAGHGLEYFDGPVHHADALRRVIPARRGEVVACIGTDEPMIEILHLLVSRGVRVTVFADRGRAVLPEVGLGRPRPALVLTNIGGVLRWTMRRWPFAHAANPITHVLEHVESRAAALHRHQVRDPWLRRQLAPFRDDRRSALHSNRYYRDLQSTSCALVFWPVTGFTSTGVRTADGLEHRVDRIITIG
jgi:cation diffusion facilitator CzcD-associated flavoprotein CzcO